MKKIFIILVLVTLFAIATFIFSGRDKLNFLSPVSEKKIPLPTQIAVSAKTSEFIDPAGFKFKYPDNLKVKSMETNNNNIYSSLEISGEDIPGKITIQAVATDAADIAVWAKNMKTATETKLAGLPAVQIKDEKSMTTAAIDQGVLFTIVIDLQQNKDFWIKANNLIVNDFAFSPPDNQNASNNNSDSQGDVVLEGEEVIE
jgi:hypothetical protein